MLVKMRFPLIILIIITQKCSPVIPYTNDDESYQRNYQLPEVRDYTPVYEQPYGPTYVSQGYGNTIREVLQRYGATKFLSGLEKHGLMKYLEHPGLYTIFAPTNEAFDRLLKSPGCQPFVKPLTYSYYSGYSSNSYTSPEYSTYGGAPPYGTNYGRPFYAGPPESSTVPQYNSNPYGNNDPYSNPTQNQYSKPPQEKHENYEPEGDSTTLPGTLEHSIILGKFTLAQLKLSNTVYLSNIKGCAISSVSYGDVVTVNGGRIIGADYHASNGIIHIVDAIYCVHHESVAGVLEKDYDIAHKKFMQILSYVNFRPYIDQGSLITALVPGKYAINEFYYTIRYANFHQTLIRILDFIRSRILNGVLFPVNLKLKSVVHAYDGSVFPITYKSADEVVINGVRVYLNKFRLVKNGAIYDTGLNGTSPDITTMSVQPPPSPEGSASQAQTQTLDQQPP